MPNFKFIWPALHNFPQTNAKNTPVIWLFSQRNIFGTKFGSICIIKKRLDHIWIKNGHAVRFYFWALFTNLNFLNFIAWSIVQWLQSTIQSPYKLHPSAPIVSLDNSAKWLSNWFIPLSGDWVSVLRLSSLGMFWIQFGKRLKR